MSLPVHTHGLQALRTENQNVLVLAGCLIRQGHQVGALPHVPAREDVGAKPWEGVGKRKIKLPLKLPDLQVRGAIEHHRARLVRALRTDDHAPAMFVARNLRIAEVPGKALLRVRDERISGIALVDATLGP